jgi:hypothetical protein
MEGALHVQPYKGSARGSAAAGSPQRTRSCAGTSTPHGPANAGAGSAAAALRCDGCAAAASATASRCTTTRIATALPMPLQGSIRPIADEGASGPPRQVYSYFYQLGPFECVRRERAGDLADLGAGARKGPTHASVTETSTGHQSSTVACDRAAVAAWDGSGTAAAAAAACELLSRGTQPPCCSLVCCQSV